jgi:hypothetical protein
MGINPVFFKSKFLAIILAGVFLLSACSGESSSSTSTSNCVGLVCIETVNVADAGNPADADTGFGAVSDPYAIGKYEVKVGQYDVFLNAIATTTDQDAIRDLWSPDMQNLKSYVSAVGLITRTGLGTSTQPYVYTEMADPSLGANSGERAILNISWFSAARFAYLEADPPSVSHRLRDGKSFVAWSAAALRSSSVRRPLRLYQPMCLIFAARRSKVS